MFQSRYIPISLLFLAMTGPAFAMPGPANQGAKQDTQNAGLATKKAAMDTGRWATKPAKPAGQTVKKIKKSSAHQREPTAKEAVKQVGKKTRNYISNN
jgi:hypothetical protein